jgi:hypothetical protein
MLPTASDGTHRSARSFPDRRRRFRGDGRGHAVGVSPAELVADRGFGAVQAASVASQRSLSCAFVVSRGSVRTTVGVVGSASRHAPAPASGWPSILLHSRPGVPWPAGPPAFTRRLGSARAVSVSAFQPSAILRTWANVGDLVEGIVFVALTEGAYSASCLNFPFRRALATPREEDRHRMGRSHNLRADLEEPLHKLHRLDVGHRTEDGAAEAVARRTRLPAPREGLKGLGDPSLEHSCRALQRELEPRLPLPKPLDGGRDDSALGEPDLGDGGAEDESSRSSKLKSMRPMASRLYAVRHDASPRTARK